LVPDQVGQKNLKARVDERISVGKDLNSSRAGDQEFKDRAALAVAYEIFKDRVEANSLRDASSVRNDIQDELMRASEQRCQVYRVYLTRLQNETSFLGGAATTILGGLGALFTPASTARALSGAAGITSGVTAEFAEAHFRSLTIETIVKGMEQRRKETYETAIKNRENKSLAAYSIEHAIHDAINYHNACTATEGIRAAGDAVRHLQHPGPEVMKHVVNQVGALRIALDNAVAGTTSTSDIQAAEAAARGEILAALPTSPLSSVSQQPAVSLSSAGAEAERYRAEIVSLSASVGSDMKKIAAGLSAGAQKTALNGIVTQIENIPGEIDKLVQDYGAKLTVLSGIERDGGNPKPPNAVPYSTQLAQKREELRAATTDAVRDQKRAEIAAIELAIESNIGTVAKNNQFVLQDAVEKARSALRRAHSAREREATVLDQIQEVLKATVVYLKDATTGKLR
jgi:hypothetical protein